VRTASGVSHFLRLGDRLSQDAGGQAEIALSRLPLIPRDFLFDQRAGADRTVVASGRLGRPAVDDALIMFGVLEVALLQNPVALRRRVAGKKLIFFADLVSRAADTHFRAVAVEDLHSVAVAAIAAAAITVMGLTAAAMTPIISGPPSGCSVSHFFILRSLV
jgi:hypothetical protein